MPEPPLPLRVVQESMGFEGNPGNRWEGHSFAEKRRQVLHLSVRLWATTRLQMALPCLVRNYNDASSAVVHLGSSETGSWDGETQTQSSQ